MNTPKNKLEEAAYKYADTICPVEYPESFNDEQLRNAFIAGAKWDRSKIVQGAVEGWVAVDSDTGGSRTGRTDNQNQRTIEMIKELEHTVIDYERGIGYTIGIDEVVDKINEIIRYLNEKETKK